ncbi:BTB/POZ domain-containing protein [Ditylenchus destructor]|nr:BTB/POZ domain-containing protein [Ditylenchus destructor]
MKRSISTANNSDWVRLNVGGKLFQTTKSTLSTHPESFLARLANGNIPSEKDDTGAFLIDRNFEQFGTILNYFRSGVVNLDRNEKAMKDLLCEADFYNVQLLVDKINKATETVIDRTEVVSMSVKYEKFDRTETTIFFSETQEDYEVFQALRDRIPGFRLINNGQYKTDWLAVEGPVGIETVLRSFGFVQESCNENYYKCDTYIVKCWKFVRPISK